MVFSACSVANCNAGNQCFALPFCTTRYEYDDEALDVDRRNRDFGVDGRIKDKGAKSQAPSSAASASNADRSQNRASATSASVPSNSSASAAPPPASLRNQPGMLGSSASACASAARHDVHDDEPACNARPPGLPASGSGRGKQPAAAPLSSGTGTGKSAAKGLTPAVAAAASAESLSGPGRPLSAAAAPFRMSATAAPFSQATAAAAATATSSPAAASATDASVAPALLARMRRPSAQTGNRWQLVERVDRALSRLVFGDSGSAGETVAARIGRETGASVRVPPPSAGAGSPAAEDDATDEIEIEAATAAQVSAAKSQYASIISLPSLLSIFLMLSCAVLFCSQN